jgi:threonine dehydrogenase-like Zn-dependent dehydrogenase
MFDHGRKSKETTLMRAVVMRNNQLVVDDVPFPAPGRGEVLVKTLACGICGTDLHALKFAKTLIGGSRCSGGMFAIDPDRDIVMGHEFCAEVLDYGPGTRRRFKAGTRVCSTPSLSRAAGDEGIGYSSEHPGGFGEMMRLCEDNLLEVPGDLPTEVAALTEPMAVGYHAVIKARLEKRDASLVMGCGPVGLSIIAALKLKGAAPIIAADLSPRRRDLAIQIGADAVIDPKEKSPYETFRTGTSAHRPAVIFECVGIPGMIDEIMFNAPPNAKIIVAGLCMERDNLYLLSGIHKELSLQFVVGYTGYEFAETFRSIRKRKVRLDPLITGKVGIEGVANAFGELGSSGQHCKILVEPWRS